MIIHTVQEISHDGITFQVPFINKRHAVRFIKALERKTGYIDRYIVRTQELIEFWDDDRINDLINLSR